MWIEFTKSHGLGNDFLLIDARGLETQIDGEVARALCDRHRGVGGDGHDDPALRCNTGGRG